MYATCEGGCGFAWEVEGPGRGTDGKTVLRELCKNKTQRETQFSGGFRRIHCKRDGCPCSYHVSRTGHAHIPTHNIGYNTSTHTYLYTHLFLLYLCVGVGIAV